MREVNDITEFNKIIKSRFLTVVDFHAQWCGPCKQIAPFVEGLAAKYTRVTFIKVDVDAAEAIAQEYGISAMPTFKLFINGRVVDELRGADPQGLEALVRSNDVEPKAPSEMTVKELKTAVVLEGLATQAVGFSEKHEFVELLENHYKTNA